MKEVEIIETYVIPDRIHMLVKVSPKFNISLLKRKKCAVHS